jgi:glycosyltransferase involved in cell wall biosynthesis
VRLAVDALNLRRDRRGMGRIVRGVLRVAEESGIELTLIENRGDGKRARYDVIWYPWNGIRFAARAPSLVHIHDTFALHETGPNWIARRRVRGPLLRAAREATRIATDSEWSRAQIERELGVDAQRITVIPLAPDPFFHTEENAGAAPSGRPYVLMVGAGEERKNAGLLIEAFAQAFPQGDVDLVVAGSFAEESAREAARRNVRVLRETPDDERLRALYRAAACVAVPSLAEGFGLVVVEAQACGAPVVASNASALPEAAGDAALLISPRDVGAWCDALRTLVRDADAASRLRALGAARWDRAARDAPARSILAVLRDLVEQRA